MERDDGKEVAFKLSENCVLKIVKGDITEWSVDGSSDAIVSSFSCYFPPSDQVSRVTIKYIWLQFRKSEG